MDFFGKAVHIDGGWMDGIVIRDPLLVKFNVHFNNSHYLLIQLLQRFQNYN